MELVAPAGNVEKLRTAYAFGADAAYIGVTGFSLRAHAETAGSSADHENNHAAIREAAKGRRLYAALNVFVHNSDLARLSSILEELADLPLDGIIVSDIGVIDHVHRYLPGVELHLSTQANCTNASAARAYLNLGFSRIVPARELTIEEVAEIKAAVPELELEVFVHGAMCMAYSGRCYLSTELAQRSANRGDCAQPCRWKYTLSEEKRPGVYLPIEENGGLTTILSAKDLMVIDHLRELKEAGVDAVKIEGRMKSSYYVAVTTRAYRAHIDALGKRHLPDDELSCFRDDLLVLSNRGYTSGFLFGDQTVHTPSNGTSSQRYRMLGIISEEASPGRYGLSPKNRIDTGMEVDFVRPRLPTIPNVRADLYSESGTPVRRAVHGNRYLISSETALPNGTIVCGPWYSSER